MARALRQVLGARPPHHDGGSPGADVLIVGAGLAGAHLCRRLRDEGFGGRIVLLGAEPDLPYDRPPLTSDPGADTDLARTMGIDVSVLADEVHLGVTAIALEPVDWRRVGPPWAVRVSGGNGDEVLHAAVVVAATGAAPLLPAAWDAAWLLHTRRQADRLWGRVREGVELVVVGGGWIGCEVAQTAAGRGARVTLVEAGSQLLPGRVPASAAARLRDLLEAAGVVVRLDQPVAAVTSDDGRAVVRTGDRPISADVVLAALGVRPETAWLVSAHRAASGALLTDPWGRTSLPGVFALGDTAARWSPRSGAHQPGGHWTAAFHSAETVASAIREWAGASSDRGPSAGWTDALSTPADDPIAYIFSDLGQQRLLLLGDPAAGAEVWREQGDGWTLYVLDAEQRLVGVVALDRPRDVIAARRAMRAAPEGRPRVDLAALADPSAPATRCFPSRPSGVEHG